MPRFAYTALDAQGLETTGQLDAPDGRQLAAMLRDQGMFPLGISVLAVGSLPAGKAGFKRDSRVPFLPLVGDRELAAFTRQLATLLRAGMPLLRSLEVLGRQERNTDFRRVLEALAGAIKSGGTLSDAMARHPKVFDRLYVNMVK